MLSIPGPSAHSPLRVLASPGREGGRRNPYSRLVIDSLPEGIAVDSFNWRRALLERYDIVHVHWPEALLYGRRSLSRWAKRMFFLALIVRLRFGRTAAVWSVHNLRPHDPSSSVEAWLLEAWRRVCTIEIHLTEGTAKELNTTPERVRVIPHGLYPRPRAVPYDPAGPAVAVGALRSYKGFDRLARVWETLDTERPLVIAGDGEPELVDALTALSRTSAKVSFREGRLTDAELDDLIESASVVVIPYAEFANSGIAVLALSHGRPLIATSSAAVLELQQEAGAEWVHLIDSAVSNGALESALVGLPQPNASPPPLDRRNWATIGGLTADAYNAAVLSKRVKARCIRTFRKKA